MAELIYIDSNVYLDYLLNRKDKLRPLGDFAFELLRKVISCKYEILISDLVLDELNNHADEDEIQKITDLIKVKMRLIRRDDKDVFEAKKISKKEQRDALHYVLAKKGGAKIIVTRNTEHFYFSELEVKFPENL